MRATRKTQRAKRVIRVTRVTSWRLGLVLGAGLLVAVPGILVVTSHSTADRDVVAITFAPGPGSPIDWSRLRRRPVPRSVSLATRVSPSPSALSAPVPFVPARPAPSHPTPPPAITTQQALINQDRAQNGLPALTWSPCLAQIAVQNAQRMAAQGFISHTNGPTLDLGCGLGNHAGENVGYTSGGINDLLLNTLFMNSPDHRANILGPYYHYVGTAWVVAPNGYAYIAVEFS